MLPLPDKTVTPKKVSPPVKLRKIVYPEMSLSSEKLFCPKKSVFSTPFIFSFWSISRSLCVCMKNFAMNFFVASRISNKCVTNSEKSVSPENNVYLGKVSPPKNVSSSKICLPRKKCLPRKELLPRKMCLPRKYIFPKKCESPEKCFSLQ